jgi:hypothetical protein
MTGTCCSSTPTTDGISDWNLSSNIVKHISSGMQCASGSSLRPPDAGAIRIYVGNNVWIDLNRDKYYGANGYGPGFFSGAFSTYASCQDLSIVNNTVDLTKGAGPALLLFGAGSNGTTTIGEGLNFSNNALTMSYAATTIDPISVLYSLCGQLIAAYPANPADACFTANNYVPMLNSSFQRAGSPAWAMTGNVIVGGTYITGAFGTPGGNYPTYADLTQSQISTIASTFPPGNTFVPGASIAARQAAVKWDPVAFTTVASSYNSGSAGANIQSIYAAAGIVQNISVTPSTAALQFNYSAPDSRACSVDISPDGANWTRTTDGGGPSVRSLVVSNLTAGTAYQYRIMCYFDQQALYEFLPKQITSGTVATMLAANRTIQIAYQLPAGATQASITFTPIAGSPITQSCASSPCAITLGTGSYTRTITFQAANGTAVGAPSLVALTIQ